MALLGVMAGLAGAVGLTRLMASQFFGVTARDPLTFGGTSRRVSKGDIMIPGLIDQTCLVKRVSSNGTAQTLSRDRDNRIYPEDYYMDDSRWTESSTMARSDHSDLCARRGNLHDRVGRNRGRRTGFLGIEIGAQWIIEGDLGARKQLHADC